MKHCARTNFSGGQYGNLSRQRSIVLTERARFTGKLDNLGICGSKNLRLVHYPMRVKKRKEVREIHSGSRPIRLAPSLFRDISALRNIVTSAGAFVVYAPAEVTMFLSADISRNRLGASLRPIGYGD